MATLDEEDFSSDTSDEDYVPGGKVSKSVEAESGALIGENGEWIVIYH